ncbi:MAG TPA: hypothetical protein PKE29_16265 [Phycisphaerales bacterium]|nr:hypothetical protein [Phycisphaerales bacterium]
MGTIRNGKIVLDEDASLPEGTRVEVLPASPVETGAPELRPGSPEAVLRLAGTLTDEEADAIMKVVDEMRQQDREFMRREFAGE